jgi:hypothetical protein
MRFLFVRQFVVGQDEVKDVALSDGAGAERKLVRPDGHGLSRLMAPDS